MHYHDYNRPKQSFISIGEACKYLKIDINVFHNLRTLHGILPVIINKKNVVGTFGGGLYFKIEDIKKLYFTDAYNILTNNIRKIQELKNFGSKSKQYQRGKKKIYKCNAVSQLKDKYANLCEFIYTLGDSIKYLYITQLFKIEDVDKTINLFEDFLISSKLNLKVFMSKTGVYIGFVFVNNWIFWLMPYPGENLDNLIEMREVNTNVEYNQEDFSTDSIDEILAEDIELEENSDEVEERNNRNNRINSKYLKYSIPIIVEHVKLGIIKLRKLMKAKSFNENARIFTGKKFFIAINSIKSHLTLLIKVFDGIVVLEISEADYVIGEDIETILDDKIYLQPQYIFDSINANKPLDYHEYAIGNTLPQHNSPFPDVYDELNSEVISKLSITKRDKLDLLIKKLI